MPPINFRAITREDLDVKADPSLSSLNDKMREIVEAINGLMGVYGEANIFGDLNMHGKRITNLGSAQADTDAISKAVANPIYGQTAQQSAMEAVGTKMLQSTRRLNDATQQHKISSDLNKQGGIPPTIINPMTFTATATTITWAWHLLQVKYGDGTTVSVKDGSLAVTGLTNGTVYKFYPYYDTGLGAVVFVADNTNAVGAPAVAFPPGASAAVLTVAGQNQNLDGRVALSVGGMSGTPSPGGSGGGGGNSGFRW